MQNGSTLRAETRTISIAASPSAVYAFLADPYNLPRWAPDFASAVRPSGTDWLVDQGSAEVAITVRVSPEHGTIDLLAAANHSRGAFTRVVPNGEGSEYLFTLFFAAETGEAAVEKQMTVVEEELRTIRASCEG
ncbi:MAG: SRPBCC family protein [Geodermatophilaceae bacterium]|nr:SRPBCC family protein [Geodermatophilaceae bacterium]